MDNWETLHDYWGHPGFDNAPEGYLDGGEKSRQLVGFIHEKVKPEHKILELGCNVGRNLKYLNIYGYNNLMGVEINKDAIALGWRSYPDLKANMICSSIESIIKSLGDNSFDTIFTMAVLEHIAKESEWIFPEMVRVADKYIVTIEDEWSDSIRHCPRDYKKIFEPLGMRQTKEDKWDYVGYSVKARMFEK